MNIQETVFATLVLGLFAFSSTSAQCVRGDCESAWGRYVEGNEAYQGLFKDGKYHGRGVYFFTDGSFCEGDWEAGQPKTGTPATFYYPDGTVKIMERLGDNWVQRRQDVLTGECLSGDCANGFGSYQDSKGRKYRGNFLGYKYHGAGVLSYSNGGRYEGYFENGLPQGKGRYFYPNGHVDEGDWLRGRFKSPKMRVWALVVGVADYQNIAKLTYTTEDAKKFYGFLRSPDGGAIPAEQVRLLTDEEATVKNILNNMAELFSEADSNDLVIFYFAGHGKEGGFLPIDYDKSKNNMLYHHMINMELKDSRAKFKLCVADACHSGSFGATRSTENVRQRIKRFYRSFDNVKSGLAVLLSSAAEEVSLEASKLKQGVFSYFLIQGLRGQADTNENGIITVKELFDYVNKQVKSFTYGYQNPLIQGQYDDNMPVGVVPLLGEDD